jgi:predicted phage terminase large subunit-like protein
LKPSKSFNQNVSLSKVNQELARRRHLDFIDYCWQKIDPFLRGLHTETICERIDKAFEQFDSGESVFLIIKVPFRHGKTDIVSRYLPPHYLGRYPDNEVLISTYGADFANEISRASRNILKSDKYQEIYPDTNISMESASVQNWGIKDRMGSTHWVGVGGSITGKGYQLGIIDDFLKNREDAESQTIREKQWQWFTDVFLTRRAPVSITIILATPWHCDDIMGRIEKEMQNNDDFPRFETIKFPAFSDDYDTGVLFPQRFNNTWYNQQKATLGSYGTASLLQCNPVLRGGNLLKTDGIDIVEQADLPFYTNLRWFRGWDLASSEKQLLKQDPDYTVGCLLALHYIDKIPHLYIRNIKRIRAEAPERNRLIVQTAKIDGPAVKIGVESVAGYKDTYTIIKEILKGVSSVSEINVSKDKLSRATALEPIFEAGNVHLFRGDWNHAFIEECSQFPSGAHDDQVDGMVCAYEMAKKGSSTFSDIPEPTFKPEMAGLMNKQF